MKQEAGMDVQMEEHLITTILSNFVAFLSGVLILLPLSLFCVTRVYTVLDADQALIHIVFVFSAFAGMLTEVHKKQLEVSVLLET